MHCQLRTSLIKFHCCLLLTLRVEIFYKHGLDYYYHMPVGVSSQWTRIWSMEWNDANIQTGVPMPVMTHGYRIWTRYMYK